MGKVLALNRSVTSGGRPKVSIAPTAAILNELRTIARAEHTSVSSVIYRAIDLFLAERAKGGKR